jgi:hypothetical protein
MQLQGIIGWCGCTRSGWIEGDYMVEVLANMLIFTNKTTEMSFWCRLESPNICARILLSIWKHYKCSHSCTPAGQIKVKKLHADSATISKVYRR